jgi:peptidoglycan/xylan/chitin deacetylase (PgdA/CDA1 family)
VTAAALMYHDVTPEGLEGSSGFPGGDAARYKLSRAQFAAHTDAIARRVRAPVLTFDDGGASAEWIADMLDRHQWRGQFFITTGYLNRPGFLSTGQLRGLHKRRHMIGSHSHSHPLRMASCSDDRLREEWRRSTSVLADALGVAIITASVPGGLYSSAVARAAAEVGVKKLYTSQPTLRVYEEEGVQVFGRFAIQRTTSPHVAAALAAGDRLPRARWSAAWTVRSLCKAVAGPVYLRVRARMLGASPDMKWGDELSLLPDVPPRV